MAWARASDLKNDVRDNNQDRACKACSQRMRMLRVATTEEWKAHQLRMTSAAANREITHKRSDDERHIASIMTGAKGRCSKTRGSKNYAGRGIEFRFDSIEHAVQWIMSNLGPRPSKLYSIDRIDNDRHYEPGNLRWATRAEQNLNKRVYRVGPIGARIRKLLPHCDYSYETIRTLIKRGLTDDEIINRKKWGGCGKP